jgi:hypothetical protein
VPVALAFVLAIALVPALVVMGLWFWARWLGRRAGAPRWAVFIAYVFVVLAALPVVGGAVRIGARWGQDRGAGAKARALAEAISEAMNCCSLGLFVAVAGMIWLAVCTWRWRRVARRRLVTVALSLLVVLAAAVGILFWLDKRQYRGDRLREAVGMVASIRVAQEGYHAETQAYASISVALAANQRTNHAALYPQAPREPGRYATAWGDPCWVACNAGMDWSVLPVHVDGPVVFGYSTIAGRAGERPTAVVTIDGKAVSWPTPTSDWFIITAVGDVEGKGVFTTVLASSFSSEILIDRGSP